MDTHADPRALSRRTVIGGLSAVGAGTLVSGATVLTTGSAAAAAPPIPTEVQAAAPKTEVLGYLDFWPFDSATGFRQVGSEATRFGRAPATAPGALVAPVRLPVGSTVTQVQVSVTAVSGQPLTVRVESTDVASGAVQVLGSASVTFPDQVATIPLNVAYGLVPLRIVADLPANGVVHGARVTYSPYATRHFVALMPQRRLDTRQSGGIITPGQVRSVAFTDLPENVTAVALNLTLNGTVSSGWLAAYPAGGSTGGTSTVNWTASGQTVANGTTVGVSTTRAVSMTTGGAGNTHLIVDLLGYHLSA